MPETLNLKLTASAWHDRLPTLVLLLQMSQAAAYQLPSTGWGATFAMMWWRP